MSEENVRMWNLHGVTLTHFDGGCTRPYPILKAINNWLEETHIAPTHIVIEAVYNPDSEQYEYLGTVEWDSAFVVE